MDKPRQWSSAHASIFQDDSVVGAYQHRPPYPPETFTFLSSLIPPGVTRRTVLDAGCGTGFIARPFAPLVDQIDAVDISQAMIRMAQALPGGNRPNIRWLAAPVEAAPLHRQYALIVAAASLHWMDWKRAATLCRPPRAPQRSGHRRRAGRAEPMGRCHRSDLGALFHEPRLFPA